MGCSPDDEIVLKGRDRLHGLPGDFTVVRCRGCGLIRTSPRPTQDAIGMYYPDDYGPYASTRATGPPAGQTPASRIRQAARRLLAPKVLFLPDLAPGRILEIGCGAGAFLQRMNRMGWEVEGLELSPRAGEEARRLGFPVFIGSLDAAPDPDRSYDLIIGWMVLEHLHDPVQMLRKLWRWSSPGGWLALSVPDAGGFEFKVFRDSWYALDVPRHLFHFTPDTARLVLARGGWRTERVFWHDNPNNLLLSLRYRCQDRGWNRAAEYLREVVEGRRQARTRLLLGKALGALRMSGRMTIWARRADE
jgi:SAM-dependent methyltransferase